MTWIKTILFVFLSFFALLITSCRIEQTLDLDSANGAQYSFSAKHAPFFKQTMEDAALFSGYSESDIFLADELKHAEASLAGNPEVNHSDFNFRDDTITGKISILNLEDFFLFYNNNHQNQSLFINEKNEDLRHIFFHFTRENVKSLLPLIPLLENPAFSAFTPMGTEGLTEESYLDDLSFSFGKENLSLFTSNSFILNIQTEQSIHSYKHTASIQSESINDHHIVFTLPLIRLMLMDEELTIEIYLTQ